MLRLVQHIGTETIGTTAIQRSFHSNRYRFVEDGWTRPRSQGEPERGQGLFEINSLSSLLMS
jgi:hypothetical protein